MKNTHIKAGEEVPIELRKEVYRVALGIIERRKLKFELSQNHICLLLPCILWGLNSFLEDGPNECGWDCESSKNMFPEIVPYLDAEIYNDIERINFLKSVI